METNPNVAGDRPLDLGPDGEGQFERLRASIEHGQGFELYFCGFDSWSVLAEVKRRLAAVPPVGHVFEILSLEGPAALRTMAEGLAAIGAAPVGRKIVFAAASGWEEDVKAEWAMALRRLNERRNITIRDCPNAIILAGPSWLPWLAHDEAPDFWAVRTAVFTFPSPPASRDRLPSPEPDRWRSGLPMDHELQPPTYYEELAAALEGSRRPGEQSTLGRLLLRASAAWELRGEYDAALVAANRANKVFAHAHEEVMAAISMSYIADILQQRGETDEALRIRREEELPVYERLGDVHARAMTMGKIADILQQRGETDEALRICREEELLVYERLGDVHARAMTMGKIADILQRRGETDEALRIRREEELPVYERLGDVHARAMTMGKIADILQQRGETEEALRIRREEELPVYERLGDVRSRAVTMGKIADILKQRGETEEALRIWMEECLPALEKAQDINSIASIRFFCGRLRFERGDLDQDKDLTILHELGESFTLFAKLQRADGVAIVGRLFGQVLADTGHVDEALRVLDESAAAFEQLKQLDQEAEVRAQQQKIRERIGRPAGPSSASR